MRVGARGRGKLRGMPRHLEKLMGRLGRGVGGGSLQRTGNSLFWVLASKVILPTAKVMWTDARYAGGGSDGSDPFQILFLSVSLAADLNSAGRAEQ
ncbi:hypothetical protein BaRGS_00028484 [Batillaria attramentaria]|uniref:Uncharacterized protein n=1 Tax=Batillaria attramentaria TaxID=370345 RepID=A0ABD0K067_9CAEN